ncbi:MAG: polysaccharide deacetylase family protein [Sphingobacteriales bacterium]|nr:MAG: polysaccharide deacetylase family protein [Sphingobacteriales bacterium]
MAYQVKTPWWLSHLVYPRLIWKMPASDEPTVYITFDDGPHPIATRYALDMMEQYHAKATFFCIGKNVVAHPELYSELLAKGHTTGNHTYNHLNGWKSKTKTYLENIHQASSHINSRIFRPPYGKIRRGQASRLLKASWKIYMWDVLSGDFDRNITGQQCAENVLKNIQPGSIIVFHDSEKAWERMSYALPQVLAYCKNKNWMLKALPKY